MPTTNFEVEVTIDPTYKDVHVSAADLKKIAEAVRETLNGFNLESYVNVTANRSYSADAGPTVCEACDETQPTQPST